MSHSSEDIALEADMAEARATKLLSSADRLMLLQASRPWERRVCRLWLRLRLRGEKLRPLHEYFHAGGEMELIDLHRSHTPLDGAIPDAIDDPRRDETPAEGAILALFQAESPRIDADEGTRSLLDRLTCREEMATALIWIRLRRSGRNVEPLAFYLDNREAARALRRAYRFNLAVAPYMRRAFRVKDTGDLRRIFDRSPAPE